MILCFLYLEKKIASHEKTMDRTLPELENVFKTYISNTRYYRELLLYLSILYLSTNKVSSAIRILMQVVELIETNWLGENEVRMNNIINALYKFAHHYPHKENINQEAKLHIQYLKDTNHRYHKCEYFPYLSIGEILKAKLDT